MPTPSHPPTPPGHFRRFPDAPEPIARYGTLWKNWSDWISGVCQFLEAQDSAIQAAMEAADGDLLVQLQAAQAAIADLQAAVEALEAADPPEVTQQAVLDALSAPLSAITPNSGNPIVTASVLGVTLLAGDTGPVIENVRTRVNDLEGRMQALGLIG